MPWDSYNHSIRRRDAYRVHKPLAIEKEIKTKYIYGCYCQMSMSTIKTSAVKSNSNPKFQFDGI